MEAFIARSNECLNRVVDHIGGLENKSDVRRYTDVYQHLLKVQRAAIEAGGDDASVARFDREWAVCEPTLGSPGDGEEGSRQEGGEQPSAEQLEEFKRTVAAWFVLDDEERELRKRVGEKRMLKGRLTSIVVAFMQRFDIEDLKTRDGSLRMIRSDVKKMPPRSIQMQRIMDFFGQDKQEEANSFKCRLFEAESVERFCIRRLRK